MHRFKYCYLNQNMVGNILPIIYTFAKFYQVFIYLSLIYKILLKDFHYIKN